MSLYLRTFDSGVVASEKLSVKSIYVTVEENFCAVLKALLTKSQVKCFTKNYNNFGLTNDLKKT